MASLVVPRSLNPVVAVLLLLATIAISFTADVADSARAPATTPTTATAKQPIEVCPGCSKTLMPKRCSFRLSNLIKTLAETKAIIGGPELAAPKLKNDSCVTDCGKVVDETTAKAAAGKSDEEALKALKQYLYDTAINTYGPIGPCECNCPEPCTGGEADAVKKLGDATGAMRDVGNQLESVFDDGSQDDDGDGKAKKAAAAEMEKSMDSSVLHASCGLTREPQRCSDELTALPTTTKDATNRIWELQHLSEVKPPPALDAVIETCTFAVEKVNLQIYSAESQVKNLTELRDTFRSRFEGDGKAPPVCTYSCPPPPEKPCTANETAIVERLTSIRNAWAAGDQFLTELLHPAEAKKGKEEEPKKTEKY